ncbi:2-isopropylmalate synthase [Planctomycetes bacterium Poly30]|uniref:2-isopropylmalate synthase n=1 Tax=Saltatorellus ferox TaxID=2528018 RepID=A0A518EXD5_9BACT|nr:2-isopropylmalate synthase [Planctomycetes bacterium Poly30]
MEPIKIFDTTLRDGEQAPGFTMRMGEKLQLAKALASMGVDVIEAGFPAASPDDFRAVQTIADGVAGPTIAALARCHSSDIDAARDALANCKKPRIHVFLATSAIHREHKLKLAKDEILTRTRIGVARARSYCADVEFSPEDASRTERDFLGQVIDEAIRAGATTINIPDTVGYTTPQEFEDLFRWIGEHVPGAREITLSAHCHDDLGLAVANSLAAIRGGARQVECTLNGIGERAGNAALEEIVMALNVRPEEYGVTSAIDTKRLVAASRLLSRITGIPVPPNKAIVGKNAFAHEAGIHQHGMLEHASTYEIMTPESVGFDGERFVLGKHSGRHALKSRLNELGHGVADEDFDAVFAAFKELADRKREILDADLEVLVVSNASGATGPWTLLSFHTSSGTGRLSTSTVSLTHETAPEVDEAATGDGPVDATFRALMRATQQTSGALTDFHVASVTLGEDAQGQVTVDCERGGRTYRGVGYSTDIVEASAHAILDVINQWERASVTAPEQGMATAGETH